jgi:predicted choloylglycine hydrolase
MQLVPVTFRAIHEPELGPTWAALFQRSWPGYREWFLSEGEEARPSYATSVRMLRAHMPELIPVYDRLVELAGGGDLASRMLSCYRPPPYLAACSQGVWSAGEPLLVRNYDYAPSRLEGVILSTRMIDRRVIGMSDSLWGLLDGMNDTGLAVSLTFGGRRALGDGFGIPIVLRYVLETCSSVAEATATLARLPYMMAHNLTLVDSSGDYVTAHVGPDREPVFARFPAATNHQGLVEWPEQAKATRTVEREWQILKLLQETSGGPEAFADAFLEPPMFSTAYERGFGTLYTAVYRPSQGRMDYRWPGVIWPQSFEAFAEGTHEETLAEGAVA